jgi:hypothetical protein
MKTTVLKTAAILLILAGIFSCRKDKDKDQNDSVPYMPCPCEGKEKVDLMATNAQLFKDSIPSSIKNKYNTYVIYHSDSDSATFYTHPDIFVIYHICNFPDYAKKWDIPRQGCEIYLKGQIYRPCYTLFHPMDRAYYDIVLTTLKLK